MEYWSNPDLADKIGACRMELRAQLAWQILEKYAVITGKHAGEDSKGRAYLCEMPPAEVVSRAFEIADEFVRIAEERGQIKPETMTETDLIQRVLRQEELRYSGRLGKKT